MFQLDLLPSDHFSDENLSSEDEHDYSYEQEQLYCQDDLNESDEQDESETSQTSQAHTFSTQASQTQTFSTQTPETQKFPTQKFATQSLESVTTVTSQKMEDETEKPYEGQFNCGKLIQNIVL